MGQTPQEATTTPSSQQPTKMAEQEKITDREMKELSPVSRVPEYGYNPQGRRDPFRSILAVEPLPAPGLSPLQRADIAEMKLTGIVWGSLGYSAIIELPDGKGYTIRTGTVMGRHKGVVKRITEEGLTVREEFTDIFGVKRAREIALELHPQKERNE